MLRRLLVAPIAARVLPHAKTNGRFYFDTDCCAKVAVIGQPGGMLQQLEIPFANCIVSTVARYRG